jgi:hypothetical protein
MLYETDLMRPLYKMNLMQLLYEMNLMQLLSLLKFSAEFRDLPVIFRS